PPGYMEHLVHGIDFWVVAGGEPCYRGVVTTHCCAHLTTAGTAGSLVFAPWLLAAVCEPTCAPRTFAAGAFPVASSCSVPSPTSATTTHPATPAGDPAAVRRHPVRTRSRPPRRWSAPRATRPTPSS